MNEEIAAGKPYTFVNNLDQTLYEPRPSTCFASVPDRKSFVSLKMAKAERVFAIVVFPQPRGEDYVDTLGGASFSVGGMYCGSLPYTCKGAKSQAKYVYCRETKGLYPKGDEITISWSKKIQK